MEKGFSVNFAKFLRTPFFIEHLWWLLLKNDLKNAFYFILKALFGHVEETACPISHKVLVNQTMKFGQLIEHCK